jgi:hypothetical protein
MLKQHPQIRIVTLSLISLTVLRVYCQMLLFFEKVATHIWVMDCLHVVNDTRGILRFQGRMH